MAAILGLTGGIACGKSAAAKIFAEFGVPVVDADEVARAVVVPNSDGLRAIVEAVGSEVLDEAGALDRKKLGARVFGNEDERAKLNAILHPRIGAESMRRLAEESVKNVPYVLYDAALLVENGSYRMFAGLIVVTTGTQTQRDRLMARDGLSADEAEQRIRAQMPLSEKVAVADYVIENRGSIDDLRSRVRQVHSAITSKFATKASG